MGNIKKLLAPAMVLALASPAFGEDSFWDGFYAGVHGGGASGPSDQQLIGSGEYDFDMSGAFGGLQVGVNAPLGNGIILGLEGDVSWGNISGSCNLSSWPNAACSSGGGESGQSVSWMSSLRARAGIDMGEMMPYLTGGLAIAGAERTFTSPDPHDLSDSATHIGLTAGAGVEFVVGEDMTLGAEYRYSAFDDQEYILGNFSEVVGFDLHTFRLSLNWLLQ